MKCKWNFVLGKDSGKTFAPDQKRWTKKTLDCSLLLMLPFDVWNWHDQSCWSLLGTMRRPQELLRHQPQPRMLHHRLAPRTSYFQTSCLIRWRTTICIVVVFQSLSHLQLFVTPWTAPHQASLSFTISQSLLKFMSIEWVMLSKTISFSATLFSFCLQSVPASGSFLMSQLFTTGGQSIGASASTSVLPMSIQDWFPLGLSGFILLSKLFSRVFSSTIIQKHQFFGAQPSFWSISQRNRIY